MSENTIWGVPVRSPTESELSFFQSKSDMSKPDGYVGGYAAPDNSIVLNPYTSLSDTEKQSVAHNEALRVLLRQYPDIKPSFELTQEQQEGLLGGYSGNPQDINNTLFARIITGDPSAKATQEQANYAAGLFARLMEAANVKVEGVDY